MARTVEERVRASEAEASAGARALLADLLAQPLPEQRSARPPSERSARPPPERAVSTDDILRRLLQEELPREEPPPPTQGTLAESAIRIVQGLGKRARAALSGRPLPDIVAVDFAGLDLPDHFQAAAIAAVERYWDLEQRYAALSAAVAAYGEPLPVIYRVEADQVNEALYAASTALDLVARRLREIYQQAGQWSKGGVLQRAGWQLLGQARLRMVTKVTPLLDDAARYFDQAEAGLARIAALPTAVAAQVQALRRLARQHQQAGDALARRDVAGPQLEAERAITREVQRIIEALPQALQDDDREALPRLSPRWVADTHDIVGERRDQLNASLERLGQWQGQVDALDAQFVELRRRLLEDRKWRERMAASLRPEVLLAERKAIEARLATLSGRRRGITVASFDDLAQALDEGLDLAARLLARLAAIHKGLTYVAAMLPELSRRLATLRQQIERAAQGPLTIAWDATLSRVRGLEQALADSARWPALKSTEQLRAEVQQLRRLDEALAVEQRRVTDILQKRATMASQVEDPLLQRDEAWVQDVVALAEQTRAYGSANWPRELAVGDLGRDARRAVNAKGVVPEPGDELPELHFDQAVDNVAYTLTQFQAFDRRIAEVRRVLGELRRQSEAARDRAAYAIQLIERALEVAPRDRTLQGLRSEAQRLLVSLNPPVKKSVADLARRVEDLHSRAAAGALAAAKRLRAEQAGQLAAVSETLREIRVLAPFGQDPEVLACQQAYDQLVARQVALAERAPLERVVPALAALADLLDDGRRVRESAGAFLHNVRAIWSVVADARQQAHDELAGLERSLYDWPPVRLSLSEVEAQIVQADALADAIRHSESQGAFNAQASHAINAYGSCRRSLQAERQRAQEQRERALQYVYKLSAWDVALVERIGQSDIPPELYTQAENRLHDIRGRLQSLYEGRLPRTNFLRLTRTSIEGQLRALWQDAQKDIVAGSRPRFVVLRVKEANDGSIRFNLLRRLV